MKALGATVWENVSLGQISEFRRGLTYKKRDEAEASGTPVLRANNISLYSGELDLTDIRYIRSSVEVPDEKKVKRGSILICTASGSKKHLGKSALIKNEVDYAFGGFMGLLVPRQCVEPQYLQWVMRSDTYWQFIHNLSDGTNINNLKFKQLCEFLVPLPPLKEQRRIIAVLSQVFEGLDRARTLIESNLHDARHLFESWAKLVFGVKDGNLSDSTVGELCSIQSGVGFPKKHQGQPSGDRPFYKVSDMNLSGNEWALSTAANYVSEDLRRALGAKIFPRDSIVFPKVGGAIITNKKRVVKVAGCVDNNVMGLIPNAAMVVPEYIHEWLRSVNIYEFSNKASLPSITKKTVGEWPIRLPTRETQKQLAELAQAIRRESERLSAYYSKKCGDLDDLRQSLLQRAFAGKLT